ncbi:MAG TPA: dockerin type I domain-containing protein [Phycisphaerae bacterium]|nr:dockerin type I domain-containing protein [Phycisphaerae bacterium]
MVRQCPGEEDRLQVHVPQELVNEMRKIYPSGGPVPAQLDEAILAAARVRIATRRRAWIVLRRVSIAVTAAAAAIGLAVWIGQGGLKSTPSPEMMIAAVTPAGPKDIDRNGRVDILDAFILARHLDERLGTTADTSGADALVGPQDSAASARKASGRGEARPSDWDVNGDGVIDQGDVDAVAMAAVSLKGGAS